MSCKIPGLFVALIETIVNCASLSPSTTMDRSASPSTSEMSAPLGQCLDYHHARAAMARSARAEPARETAPEAGGAAARRGPTPRLALLGFCQGRAADGRGGRCDRRHGAWTGSKTPATTTNGCPPWRGQSARVCGGATGGVSPHERCCWFRSSERQLKEISRFRQSQGLVRHTENEGLFSGSADSDERTGFVNPKRGQKGGWNSKSRETMMETSEKASRFRRPRLRLAR